MMSVTKDKLVFTFPGQGSFDRHLLRNLYLSQKQLRPFFYAVDEATGSILGTPFLPLVLANGEGLKPRELPEYQDLDQLGIYLTDYATAQVWLQQGVRPDLLLGHSFGELAAFAVAGIYSFEDGARIVCQRILSLRETAIPGKMAAVAASEARVRAALKEFANVCSVSVMNHSGQTVVSGPEQELVELRDRLARQAISVTLLQSKYPFHSSLLSASSRTFLIALRGYRFEKSQYRVFVGTEQCEITAETDLTEAMARQLVTPLDFETGVRRLFAEGYVDFLECGAGTIVTKIVASILKEENGHRQWATFPTSDDVEGNLLRVGLERSTGARDRHQAQPSTVVTEAPAKAAEAASASPLVHGEGVTITPEPSPFEPIAIVGMGCVFPGGADGPDRFWENIVAGVSGIVDLTKIDPNASEDFVAGKVSGTTQEIVSDKTYTLLNGSILSITYNRDLLGARYSQEEFELLTKGQKILAVSMAQACLPSRGDIKASRQQCILGSTADGWAELDEAHFGASVREVLDQLEAPQPAKKAFSQVLSDLLPGWKRNPEDLSPHKLCSAVALKMLGVAPEGCYLVDSACSSSLYALALGARALRAGEADVVYAGGVFAPGPANNNLFAQFRGLTPNESRPFDTKADGVVFGDGAGILALKRLSDAIDDGNLIYGVIRSEGFSSDGKSPSINVPQSSGQALALKAAYSVAALDPKSVQYVEAHATATPVGDAVEFKALRDVLPPPDGACRQLGSVKALIGHTGWASGVASVIKICKMLEHRRIPKQFSYDSPNPSIEFKGTGFAIPTEEIDWPENAQGLPRRAGVSGFGFGGTNAHFVVEEYHQPYHSALAERFRGKPVPPAELVVVAADGILPEEGRCFDRKLLRMPKKRLVLPDVAEHMDASQYLATMAAEKIADTFPQELLKSDLRIGVALGLESKTERGVRANERVFLDRLSRVVRGLSSSQGMIDRVRAAITAKVHTSGPYTLPGLMPNVAASRITHTFDWHGPNIVIDRGKGSLAQALDAGIKFVQAGDCEVALAGGVNAWTGHRRAASETVTLVAFATADTAKKYKLPILARLQFKNSSSGAASRVVLDNGDGSFCGATGAVELLAAIREVSRKSSEIALMWNGTPLMTLVPANGKPVTDLAAKEKRPAEVRASHAYVQGTAIKNYTHVLRDSPTLEARGPATSRSYLFLADQPEAWRKFESGKSLHNLNYAVVTPSGAKIHGAQAIDASSDDSMRKDLERLQLASFDTIVAVKDLSSFSDVDLLLDDFRRTRGLLDLLFGICRWRYDDIAAGKCAVATICLGALRTGGLDGYTGLFGGFVKSLARELPDAACKAVSTDESRLVEVLAKVAAELDANDKIAEVAYRDGKRLRNVLTEVDNLRRDCTPWVCPESVVLATGGGRGVTAVLVQHLMESYGCKVIALGRTDPGDLPEKLRPLDEAAFREYESQFYREQLAIDRSKKMPELKKLYEHYQASHEVVSVIRGCAALPGTYEYIQCDINDSSSIDRVVEDVLSRYGRLDMVLHGAGVQVSKIMPRKNLADFQRVVTTKLASLGNLYQACHKRGIQRNVHFHILTSAFSYLGNDGQPDYGAANETMNRLAAGLNLTNPGCYWSSLAWLGWAGIGMTRGTEYAALAASRRLRGITREEGSQIFADAIAGPPLAPINILLAEGEVAYYRPEIQMETPSTPITRAVEVPTDSEGIVEWPITTKTMPFLFDHVVRGVPTVPGSFIIAMAADAGRRLVPDLKVVQFERTRFLRLIRAYEGRPANIRALSKVVERNSDAVVVRVQIVADFVHKSGELLAKDQLYTEIFVRMAKSLRMPLKAAADADVSPGVRLPDPYVMDGSPVRLNGAFRTLKEVVVSRTTRRAEYMLNGHGRYNSDFDYLIPNIILVDAFWRFGTVQANDTGGLSVYVPEKCDAMEVFFDYSDFDADVLRNKVTFQGANPRPEGDLLHVGPIGAFDSNGRMLLRVKSGICRKFGDIKMN
jgi:3-oxoacyl-(acyl-carrier-protein) synthase/NAD(P)-dependent dehydrogenase (short-subunit alcohol dehydrogenase family)